jgi:hypothetical protein
MAKTTELGKFISTQRTYPSGDIVGYRVRSPKSGVEQYFGIKTFGTLDKALAEARKYAKEKLKVKVLIGDSEEYLKLRNSKKDLSSARFAKYLNDNTDFVPERGKKFTTDGIKQVDNKINFKSDVRRDKRIIPENIKNKVFEDYKAQRAKGERNLSVISRKYFPDLTRDQQSNIIRKILVEKGEDISQFKKVRGPNFDEVKDRGAKVRTGRLNVGKKAAGFSAGRLSDKLVSDIRKLNKDILKMSDKEILSNQKIINAMKINTNVNNLNRGIVAFDKYEDLSPKELVKKIKDRARQGIFWQPEHISSVKGEAKNIYYPNNLQAAPGNIGSFMENFKKMAAEDPNNPLLRKGGQIDKLLSDYNLTVRDPNTKVRLGFKDVIEVDSANKTSNIIKANAASLAGNTNLLEDIKNIYNSEPKNSVFRKGMDDIVKCADGCFVKVANKNPEKTLNKINKEPQKLIRLFRGESFPQRNTEGMKSLAKNFNTSLDAIKKQSLSGQWFTPNQQHSLSYLSAPGRMKYVDVTPAELESFNRYKDRVNKTNLKYSARPIKQNVTTSPHHQIIPRYKLKEMEKSGRLKTAYDLNPLKNRNIGEMLVKPTAGVLEYNVDLGAFVDSRYPTQKVSDLQIKNWATENPMSVKAGTEDALKPIKGNLLKTVGKSLAYVGAPLPTALIDSYFVGKQIAEDRPAAEIAKDPLNWLGLATMSTLSEISGVSKPGKMNAALRLGMSPGLIRGVSRFAGIPGLAISTALTAYDQYNKYKNEEGLIYDFFNKVEEPI